MKSLQETSPDKAAFFMDLFAKAKAMYSKDDYISVCPDELLGESVWGMCEHMDIEMVRLGFEFGRMYERLGVIV